MGAIVSSLFGFLGGGGKVAIETSPADMGPESDIVEKATGLTPRQVAYVTTTWDLVKPNMKEHALGFFLLFFKTNPDLQSRFNAFKNVPYEELHLNKRFAAHGSTVLSAIDSYVANLNDPECLVEMLKTTGVNHKNRKISKSDFSRLPPVLVEYLGSQLGSAWSKDAKQSWEKLLSVILAVIFSAYD